MDDGAESSVGMTRTDSRETGKAHRGGPATAGWRASFRQIPRIAGTGITGFTSASAGPVLDPVIASSGTDDADGQWTRVAVTPSISGFDRGQGVQLLTVFEKTDVNLPDVVVTCQPTYPPTETAVFGRRSRQRSSSFSCRSTDRRRYPPCQRRNIPCPA